MIIIRKKDNMKRHCMISAIYHRKTPNVEAVISVAESDSGTANKE